MPRNLSKTELEEIWEFLPDGRLLWRNNRRRIKAGDEAGCTNKEGYRVITLSRGQYKVHRLVYAYHTGSWPAVVDHINGDRADNRISNLRALNVQQNLTNTNKTSGSVPYRGVTKIADKYRALIQCKGAREWLGLFNTPKEAHEAYKKRREELNPGIVGVK